MISHADLPPEISPRRSPQTFEGLLERMKRLAFSKPVTRWLTPGLMTTLTLILTLQDTHDA